MGIFCNKKPTVCSTYSSDINLEFQYIEGEAGTIFRIADKREKHLLFFLEGSVKVRYNEFPNKVFNAGEMIFIPQSADCIGETLSKYSFIVHTYSSPVKLCDRAGLNSIIDHAQQVKHEFISLPINDILHAYLLLLKSYLREGINCRHMHEIKQKELFLILRAFYQKDKLAQLFYPILGKSLDFRSKVMTYYAEARTASELAGFCRYSETHFNELFVAEFGETPYKWMQKQKAKHIIGRLSQSEVSLKEIADEFNFTSQSHFNKYCKAQFGESAIQIRRKIESGNQQINKNR